MNEPKRLLEGGSSKARALLLAGRREVSPESLVPSVVGALGLTATVTAFVPSWSAKLAGLLKPLLSYKLLGVGVIVVAAAGGYVAGRIHERALQTPLASPRTETRAAAPAHGDSAMAATRAAPVEGTTAPGVRMGSDVGMVASTNPASPIARPERPVRASPAPASPVIAFPAAPSSSPSAGAATVSSPSPSSASSAQESLGDELDSIRKARANVLAGKGREALDGLDAYARAHPAGAFQEEALALRVRASRLVGDGDGAAKELAELEARFPNSVHLAALHAGSKGR
jgi:hypothetical protein